MTTQSRPDNAGVIMFPPLLYGLTLATGLVISYFFPYRLLPTATALPLGIGLILTGFVIVRAAAGQMNRHKTTINPAGVTTTIVGEGIYRRTRNPMYISFALMYSGIALIVNAWVGLLLLIPLLMVVQKGIIEREERYLTRKFGDDYLRYKTAFDAGFDFIRISFETNITKLKIMNEKILITLATGKTGYATTVELLNAGYPVRLFVRSRNTKVLELEKLGAEISIGEFDNYEQIKTALIGINRVYYCYPIMPKMPENVALFIEAAKEANVDAVVFMGQRIAEFADTGSMLTNNIRTTYRLLEKSGLNVIYFIPGYFADNAFLVTEFVLQLGLFASPFGAGKNPWISNGDMGRVVAALLKNPTPYIGQRLFPTGSKSISAKEIVTIFSKVSGRKVTLINSPDWLFVKAAMMLRNEFGVDAFTVVQANFYNRQMQLNRFDIEPTDVVKRLTGREPEDFETITRDYFAYSSYRQRTVRSWFSAMKKFVTIPFTPALNAEELAKLNQ